MLKEVDVFEQGKIYMVKPFNKIKKIGTYTEHEDFECVNDRDNFFSSSMKRLCCSMFTNYHIPFSSCKEIVVEDDYPFPETYTLTNNMCYEVVLEEAEYDSLEYEEKGVFIVKNYYEMKKQYGSTSDGIAVKYSFTREMSDMCSRVFSDDSDFTEDWNISSNMLWKLFDYSEQYKEEYEEFINCNPYVEYYKAEKKVEKKEKKKKTSIWQYDLINI